MLDGGGVLIDDGGVLIDGGGLLITAAIEQVCGLRGNYSMHRVQTHAHMLFSSVYSACFQIHNYR